MWKNVGYYDGRIGPLEDMMVPIGDRALYFGDGIYEAANVANGVVFAFDEHLERMYNSLRLLEIPFTLTKDEVKAELQKVIAAADAAPAYLLYWQVSRGVAPRNHQFPDASVRPTLMATLKPHGVKSLSIPYNLITAEDIRFKYCNIKTLNLIPNVIAKQRAVEQGCDEVVLHRGSRVTECSHSNIFILQDGVLRTAPTDELILPGITRKQLLNLAKELNIDTDESPFSVVELMNADEVIVTSTSAYCMRVENVDHIPVGGKDPVRIKQLQKAFWDKFLRDTHSC